MASDKILISRLECLANVGVTQEEQSRKQRLSIDLEFVTDTRRPAGSDSISDTIDYSRVAAAATEVCASQPFHLIETIAERIAERVLREFPIHGTRVLVRKISPPQMPASEHVSVEIIRP
jgi:dihydroneopterin aldolase